MVSGQKSVNFYKWFTQRRRSQVMSVTRTTNTENGHLLCLYRHLFIENFWGEQITKNSVYVKSKVILFLI